MKEDDVLEVGLDPLEVPDTNAGHRTTYTVGGREVTIENSMVPWLGQLISGVVLLIAITVRIYKRIETATS